MTRRWKILLALGGFLVLAAASAFLSLHVKPGNELETYLKQLHDQGEKLALAEVLPPMAAPEENGADIVRDAVSMFSSAVDNYSAMTMVGPGRAAVGWMQPDVRGYDFTNSWEEYRARVETDQPAVELLHQVLARPRIDFQLDYSLGSKMPVIYLASTKRAEQKLEIAALLDLHDGRASAATTNILTMLALVQKDYRDDLLIGHLVRIACVSVAVPPTWEFLQSTNVTDAQLASLQKAWQQLDFLNDAARTFLLERAWAVTGIEKYRASHEAFKELGIYSGPSSGGSSGGSGSWDWESMTERPRFAVSEVMWRSSWSYAQELAMLQRQQVVLTGIRAMQTNQTQFYKADYDLVMTNLSKLGGTNAGGGALRRALKIPDFHELSSDYGSVVLRKTMSIEAARHIVITAIALKRFQLKHGQWPASLAELTPEFLPSVPFDPYDGKPLKYHPNDDNTYLLYSVGEDGIDDGGDNLSGRGTGWQWQRARDWVWPQPAMPAEIQYFREHPPK